MGIVVRDGIVVRIGLVYRTSDSAQATEYVIRPLHALAYERGHEAWHYSIFTMLSDLQLLSVAQHERQISGQQRFSRSLSVAS